MYDNYNPDDRVANITSHLARYEPYLIGSWMPSVENRGSSLQNYSPVLRGINYEMRATGTLTWGEITPGGRSVTVTNGVDSKMRTVNATASGTGDRSVGVTMEAYFYFRTLAGTSRRVVSATVGTRNLGMWFGTTNTFTFGTVGVANLATVTGDLIPGDMQNSLYHAICATGAGKAASGSYLYIKNMTTGMILTNASTAGNPSITNRSIMQLGIGDLAQTTSQENVDVMLFNCYNVFQSEQWARRRLGDPWGFISTRKRIIGKAPAVAGAGQPFNKRQGGVPHTINASNVMRQGFW